MQACISIHCQHTQPTVPLLRAAACSLCWSSSVTACCHVSQRSSCPNEKAAARSHFSICSGVRLQTAKINNAEHHIAPEQRRLLLRDTALFCSCMQKQHKMTLLPCCARAAEKVSQHYAFETEQKPATQCISICLMQQQLLLLLLLLFPGMHI